MERAVAERFERVETTVVDVARSMAQHVEAADARMTRVETNLMKLSDALGGFARSVNEFVEAANARMSRVEENVARLEQNITRMEQDLSALIRAITAERGSGQPRG